MCRVGLLPGYQAANFDKQAGEMEFASLINGGHDALPFVLFALSAHPRERVGSCNNNKRKRTGG